ncbi:hypothetical protein I4U23_025093 [Adineta vaga]|nr:hypothetical protein I4U23_025093 [Adineta vaga]
MIGLRFAVFSCFILFVFIPLGNSLKCYSCTVCNDPFNESDVKMEEKPDGEGYYCTKISVGFAINRGISKTCDPVNVFGKGQWCCQKDFCNHSSKTLPTNLLLIALIMVASIKFF